MIIHGMAIFALRALTPNSMKNSLAPTVQYEKFRNPEPPRGDIPLHKLQECLEERIRYLHFVKTSADISECCEQFKFEYLTDGSALDRTGHFMLRLIATKLNGLKEFLIDSECVLFEKRLRCLRHIQIDRELRTALRHVKEILLFCHPPPKYQVFLQNFSKLCEDMIRSKGVGHTFTDDHAHSCIKYFLRVPFTFCLPLIVSRDVELVAGQAIIPCGRWGQLLHCLFAEHLKHGMEQLSASNSYVWEDDRLKYLLRVLKTELNSHHFDTANKSFTILAKDVDQIFPIFPPCMRNFHKTLRQRHRLSHYSRFYYSLFLKDIGMPLMESIEFWSKEYALANNYTSCSHSWQRDNKKYIYSIRHMYGLEGSRRVYYSPHCQQLQKMSNSPSTDGGCPFLNFDDEKLRHCLHSQVKFDQLAAKPSIEGQNEESAIKACKTYFKALQNLQTDEKSTGKENEGDVFLKSNSTNTFSPFQFYYSIIQTPAKQL